jgi:hypothetical protein
MLVGARTGLTAVAVGASFAAGLALGGGLPSAGGDGRSGTTRLMLADAALAPATSCDQLREWYVDRALDSVTAWGWDAGPMYYAVEDMAPMPQAAGARDPATNSATGTNVQEAGVDEPDVVKTDGDLLVTVDGARLTTYDVTGATPQMLASIMLPGVVGTEILLSGDTVVAVGSDADGPAIDRPYVGDLVGPQTSGTRVLTLDVSDPAAPAVVDSRVYDSDLVAARQHGDAVRLVLSARLPDLRFVTPDGRRGDRAALEHNRQVVRETTVADWLPGLTTTAGDTATSRPAVDCSDVAIPEHDAGLGTMTVVGFRADAPDQAETTGVATASRTAYLSADRLYLATDAWSWWGPRPLPGPAGAREMTVPDGVTRLYAFALRDLSTSFLASGEVEGRIADRWAMDEAGGVLRVAVGPTSETGDFSSVITLGERAGVLEELGRVDHLGPGEEIKSVRWFDDLAIVVTFRQTDPLYAVGLADPADPRLLGELKIPGFSEYLHPLGSGQLLGVGQDATRTGAVQGAQVALFDVADLTDPRRLDVAGFGGQTQARAGADPRQFTWIPDRQTALTVVDDWSSRTGWVAVVTVRDGRLRTRTVEVEHGLDVAKVRTVPLPSGRVVLWTGDSVSFLALDEPGPR